MEGLHIIRFSSKSSFEMYAFENAIDTISLEDGDYIKESVVTCGICANCCKKITIKIVNDDKNIDPLITIYKLKCINPYFFFETCF